LLLGGAAVGAAALVAGCTSNKEDNANTGTSSQTRVNGGNNAAPGKALTMGFSAPAVEFFMVGGAGSLNMMQHIKAGDTPVVATVTYPPTMASSAVSLARLIVQSKGMSDLVELQVPQQIVLTSETITKDNVDKYLPLGFES
jgi:hypothetical protein